MTNHETPRLESATKHGGFFSIFPILAKLLWRYGKRLLSLDTLVALEKKQGAGSGERTVEEELLEQALERNPHHYHVAPTPKASSNAGANSSDCLANPVIIVRGGGSNERRS